MPPAANATCCLPAHARSASDRAAATRHLDCSKVVRMTIAVHLFILLVFLNRYVFGLYLRLVRGRAIDDTDDAYEPTITVVIPLFNEGRSIYDTIKSIVELDYPETKLSVTVVDDCSTDDSYEWAQRAAEDWSNVHVL